MDTAVAAWLIDALVVIGLVLAVWLVLSPPAFVVKLALRGSGALELPSRAAGLAQRFASLRPSFDHYLERLGGAAAQTSGEGSVRVALDERHAVLGDALSRTERQIRNAVAGVEGLAGSDGPKAVLKEIDDLRERSKFIKQLAVDLDDDLEDQYVARSRAIGEFWVAAVLVILFVSLNSMLLNMFFKDLISVRFYGFPLSAGVSMMFVAAEMALGATISWTGYRPNMRMLGWLCVVGLGCLAVIEAVILAIVSNEFELDFALFEEFSVMKSWLGLLGPVLVIATSTAGYMLHHAMHDLAGYRGATRMRREMKQANAFVASLPRTWETVDQKAQRARASIDEYLLALKGKAGELGGVVKEIKAERERLSETLLSARPSEWPSLISASAADARGVAAQNIGLLLLSALALAAYGAAAAYLFATAAGPRLPGYASIGLALIVAIAFYVVGLFPFRRLRLTVGENGRAYPFPAGAFEYAVGAVVVFGCFAGLAWACVSLFGLWGVAVGLAMTAVGGILAVLGYFMERTMSGLGLLGLILMATVVFVARALAMLIAFVAIWIVAVVAWLVTAVVLVLAKPTELVIDLRRKNPTRQPASGAAN